ncbi:AAA family ATPase [Streptosporangiaceae bacterium NEAU-GS5]|nr:AAA family ATPase [Streptosporangiaceae bacterium NEAU-GS5]
MTTGPTARAIVIAITGFVSDRWSALPFAAARAYAIRRALLSHGYHCVTHITARLTSAEFGTLVRNELRRAGPDDTLLIHILTHGDIANKSVLYALGSDGLRHPDTDVEAWIRTVQNVDGHPFTLFLLDMCYGGTMARLSWQASIGRADTRAWVIAACQPDEAAFDGRFSQAVATVLDLLRQGDLEIDPSHAYVPFGAIARAIRQEVNRLAGDGLRQQVTATSEDPGDEAAAPPFFRNTAHTRRRLPEPASQGPADGGAWIVAYFADQAAGAAVSGEGGADRPRAGRFTGRRDQLGHLAPWVNRLTAGDLAVVTGGPGSGKSALLGVLVCAAHPLLYATARDLLAEVTPLPAPVLDGFAAVHVAQRGLATVCDAIGRQLGLPADLSADELIERVLERDRPPVLVIDGLDEADDGPAIMRRLLLPLVSTRRPDGWAAARLLVGSRTYEEFEPLLERARVAGNLIDLDVVPPEDLRKDLATYIFRLLQDEPAYLRHGAVQGAFAGAVAETLTAPHGKGRQQGEFLVAGLYTRHFVAAHAHAPMTDPDRARALGQRAPRTLAEVFELDIADRPALRELLTVLATAREPGMPVGVLFRMITAGQRPGRGARTGTSAEVTTGSPAETGAAADRMTIGRVRAMLREGRHYLRQSTDTRDGTTLYRLFHRSLIDHLAVPGIAGDSLEAMLGILGPASARDWEMAEPYLLDHAWAYAVAAGRAAELLDDPEYLLNLTSGPLTAVLREAGDLPLLSAFAEVPPIGAAPLSERRYALALAAARADRTQFAARAARPPTTQPLPWQPLWSKGTPVAAGSPSASTASPASVPAPPSPAGDFELAKSRRKQEVQALATASIEGRPVLAAAGDDGRIQLWDLASRKVSLPPLTGHAGSVNAIACFTTGGRAKAVTAGSDGTLRIWDLARRQSEHIWNLGQESFLRGVACAWVGDQQVAVVASGDGWLRMWDVVQGRPVGGRLGERPGILTGVACAQAHGRAVAVTTDEDGEVSAVDLGSGEVIGRHEYAHDGSARAVACTAAADPPLVVTTGDGGVIRVWKLTDTLVPLFKLTGHRDTVEAVACATLGGRDVVISGDVDGRVIVWDVAEGVQIYQARLRRGLVRAVAGTLLGTRPFVLTAASGGALAGRDLSEALSGRQAAERSTGSAAAAAPRGVQITRLDVLSDETVRLVFAHAGAIIVDPRTGKAIDGEVAMREPAANPRQDDDSPVAATSATFSLHGRTMVAEVGDDPRTLRLREATSHAPSRPVDDHGRPLGRHESRITTVSVAKPVGGAPPLLFSGDVDGTVRVWDPVHGRAMPGFTLPGEIVGITPLRGELVLVDIGGEIIALHRATTTEHRASADGTGPRASVT